jgi:hypothetical protein
MPIDAPVGTAPSLDGHAGKRERWRVIPAFLVGR